MISALKHFPLPRQVLTGGLAAALCAVSLSGDARGPRVGDIEKDIFDPPATFQGLPANLVPGFEPAGRITGDGRITGFGGIPIVLGSQPTIISKDGQTIVLVPAGMLDGTSRQVGVLKRFGPDELPPLISLKETAIPEIPGLQNFIRNREAAIVLGKALFWDIQTGSDGTACASCHFHAGADGRTKNQLSPGIKAGDLVFNPTATGGGGPNYQLKANDFPFHKLANPLDRQSQVLFDSNDVVGSQGTFGSTFLGVGVRPRPGDTCGPAPQDEFNVQGIATRRVEPRNTPTTINAVFNYRNFWDGRANNTFNGVTPFGPRDTGAKVLEALPDGSARLTTIALRNASLASQAVGPPLSEFEMSCLNRTFKDVGRRMLSLRPLGLQAVHPQDSVLANYRLTVDKVKGLELSYPDLIRAAFQPKWWKAPGLFTAPPSTIGYTQMETNFSLFWGLAIMMYESTLVSDQAPIDKFVGWPGSPPKVTALNTQQLSGFGIFRGKGLCVSCHGGAEFTSAATNLQPVGEGEGTVVENMFLADGTLADYDNGFYNIGVRSTSDDRGVGAQDPFGNPLSFTRTWFNQLRGTPVSDPLAVDPCRFGVFFDPTACWIAPDPRNVRVAVDGAFKTPTLRNVSLTRPYFHNGSRLTLAQVVEFYNRGGDRRGQDGNDTTGYIGIDAPNGGTTNVHPDVHPLNLSPQEQADLVAFLRYALTDRRVACEKAPFDHPALKLTNGHKGDQTAVQDANNDGKADDAFINKPAVGAGGLPDAQCLRNDDGSIVPP